METLGYARSLDTTYATTRLDVGLFAEAYANEWTCMCLNLCQLVNSFCLLVNCVCLLVNSFCHTWVQLEEFTRSRRALNRQRLSSKNMSLFQASVEKNTASNSPSNAAGENGLQSAAGGECFNSSEAQPESRMQEDIDLSEYMLNLPSLSGTPEECTEGALELYMAGENETSTASYFQAPEEHTRALIPASSVLQGPGNKDTPTLVHSAAFRSQYQVQAPVYGDLDADSTLKNNQVGGPVDLKLHYDMHSNVVPSGQVSPDCPPVDSRCLQPLSENWDTKFRQESEKQRLRNSHRSRRDLDFKGVPDSGCSSKDMLLSTASVEDDTTNKLTRDADDETELWTLAGEICLDFFNNKEQSESGMQEDIPWPLDSQAQLAKSDVIKQSDQISQADFKHAANVDPGKAGIYLGQDFAGLEECTSRDDFACGTQSHSSFPKDMLEMPGMETEEWSESEKKTEEICPPDSSQQCVRKESCTSAAEGHFKPTQGVGINLLNKFLLLAEKADPFDSTLGRHELLSGFDISDNVSGHKIRNVVINSNTLSDSGMEGGIPVQALLASSNVEQSDEQMFQEGEPGAHSSFSAMGSVEGRERSSKKRHYTDTLPVDRTNVVRIEYLDPSKAIQRLTVEDLIKEKMHICEKMLGKEPILKLETSLYHVIKVHEICIEKRKPIHIHKECKSMEGNTAENCCWLKQFGTSYPDDDQILKSFRQMCTREANLAGSEKSGRMRVYPDWLIEEFKNKLKSLAQKGKGVTSLKNEEMEAYAESLGLKPSQVLHKLKHLRDGRGSGLNEKRGKDVSSSAQNLS